MLCRLEIKLKKIKDRKDIERLQQRNGYRSNKNKKTCPDSPGGNANLL